MKWLVQLLWDPVTALDLTDSKGSVDHGKAIGLLAFSVFVALIVWGRLPPLGHTIALLSAVFGSRVFIGFLKSRTVSVTESIQSKIEYTDPNDRGISDG
jgi:hypothetical protein